MGTGNYKFIVNPAASRGKCLRRAEEVKSYCDDSNLDYDLVYREKQGDAHVDGEFLSLNLNSLDVKLVPKALKVVLS